MALNKDYNARLKPITYKGLCGDPEIVDEAKVLVEKVKRLSELFLRSKHTVVFTGAGISTSCGIPDFRGPNGVWTKEQRGETSQEEGNDVNTFDTAQPSFTHYAIACLLHAGVIKHVVSQNVDGLHLRSGVPEQDLSELHGNIFKEYCEDCQKEYTRERDVGGMGKNYTGRRCEVQGCEGKLRDMAIDWDTDLPEAIFDRAHAEIDQADLLICLGTSLRIRPAGNMPLRVLRPKKLRSNTEVGELCIVNLQKTHLDKKATIRVNHYCDEVMRRLCVQLGVSLKLPADISGGDIGNSYSIRENSAIYKRMKKTNIAVTNTISVSADVPVKLSQTKKSNKRKAAAVNMPVVDLTTTTSTTTATTSNKKARTGKVKQSAAVKPNKDEGELYW